jgi:hypothetical protein
MYGSSGFKLYSRTVGLAMEMPMAPVVSPAATFRCSGTSPCGDTRRHEEMRGDTSVLV